MKTKSSLQQLIPIIFTAVLIFTVTEVLAQTTCFEDITKGLKFGDGVCAPNESLIGGCQENAEFVLEICPPADGDLQFPEQIDNYNGTGQKASKYDYYLSAASRPKTSKDNHILFTLPSEITTLESSGKQLDSDPTTGWPDDPSAYVVKTTLNVDPNDKQRLTITTQRLAPGATVHIRMKAGSAIYTYMLQGPGFAIGQLAEASQQSCETITRYGPDGKELFSFTCCFNPVTREIECTDENGDPLDDYPVGNVICTLCKDGVVEDGFDGFKCKDGTVSQTIKLDSSKDQCFLGGERNPDATWYYYRGRWYCYGTECP